MIEVMFSTDKCSDRKQVISRNKQKKGQFVCFNLKKYATDFAERPKKVLRVLSGGS